MAASDLNMFLTALERLVLDAHAEVVLGIPRQLVREMLSNGVTMAQRYGLVDPADVATFVLLMFEFGPGFHRHPAVLDVLNDRALKPQQRMARVVNETPEGVWREVVSTLHQQSWFMGASWEAA